MIAGLPGTGIGGLFYLILGLWMPFREALAGFRGRSNMMRRRQVARQLLLTVGIIVGMGLTGEMIGWLAAVWNEPLLYGATADAAAPFGISNIEVENYLHFSIFGWALLTLTGVIVSVHALRFAVWVHAFVRPVKAVVRVAPGSFESFSHPR